MRSVHMCWCLLIVLTFLQTGDAIKWLALRRAGLQWNVSGACGKARKDLGMARRQVKLCRTTVDAMPHVVKAATQATSACQAVFADRRWNCSSIEAAPDFTADLTTGTREQGYVFALSSAAIVYTISRACATGSLFHCSCAAPPRDPPNGNFKWGGCGDNTKWGAQFAKQFTDAGERRAASLSGHVDARVEQVREIVRPHREGFVPGSEGHRLGYKRISKEIRPSNTSPRRQHAYRRSSDHDDAETAGINGIDYQRQDVAGRVSGVDEDLRRVATTAGVNGVDYERRDLFGRVDDDVKRLATTVGVNGVDYERRDLPRRRPEVRRAPEVTQQERQRRRMKATIAAVNLHNNRAGRRAVESSLVTQCKCHGVSGSCNIKTCWRALPRFAEVAARLKRRFGTATEVVSRRVGAGRRLVPAAAAVPAYNQDDLIYITKSPDYCMRNAKVGSLGTRGRSCNNTSTGYDSCDEMCCGRGYRTVIVEKVERCQCKYYWCCYVKCKTCRRWAETHECN